MSEYTGAVPGEPLALPPQFPDLEKPGALEQIGAMLQLENTVVAGLTARTLPPPEDTGEFKAEFDVRDWVSFDEFMSGRFDNVRDLRQLEAQRSNIRREQQLRDTVGRGPISPIVLGLFAAGVDPFTYVGPFTAPFKALGVGGRALAGAADAALSVGAAEIVLSAQELRSGSEALSSMLLGTAFGAGVGAAFNRGSREFGTPLAPTPKYDSVRADLTAYFEVLARNETSLARPMDTTAVGRFLDSPTLKWTFERNPPPPGVIDDAALLRFAMGRNTRLFDAVEAAARKLEELDNPLNLAIQRTAPDLTPSRLERESIINRIIDLEGRNNPAAQAARAEGRSLDEIMAAMDAAPSARKDPVATTQAATLRARLAELDSVLPIRVMDNAELGWQVDKARAAALKEYEEALAKLHAQIDRERAKAVKLTQALGKDGILEAHAKLVEFQDALARDPLTPMPKGNWLDEIAATISAKKPEARTFDDKAKTMADEDKTEAAAKARDPATPAASAKGENIDFFGLCGGF